MSKSFRRYILGCVREARADGDMVVARLILNEYFFDLWRGK